MNLCFIDVETTGIDPVKNGIIQISGQLVIYDQVFPPFDFRVAPFPEDVIEDAALAVSGITFDDLKSDIYRPAGFVKGQLLDLLGEHVDQYNRLQKFFFIAYNANFDYQFLRQWFVKQGDNYFGSWFFHPPIDVMGLAAAVLMERRPSMRDFKLATVAREFDIEVESERLHDALYDIYVSRLVYNRIGVRNLTIDGSWQSDEDNSDIADIMRKGDSGNGKAGQTEKETGD